MLNIPRKLKAPLPAVCLAESLTCTVQVVHLWAALSVGEDSAAVWTSLHARGSSGSHRYGVQMDKIKKRDAVRLVTKPDLTSAHAAEHEVRFSQVALHSAKPLPAAVSVQPGAPSPALGHCVNGADQRDGGAVMQWGIHFVRTHHLGSRSATTVP